MQCQRRNQLKGDPAMPKVEDLEDLRELLAHVGLPSPPLHSEVEARVLLVGHSATTNQWRGL